MFDGFDPAQLQWLAIIGAGLVIGALALVVGQRALHRPDEELVPVSLPDKDPFTHSSPKEKRRAFRRKGKYVEVEVTDLDRQQTPWRGWVVDRSIKGLRVSLDHELPVGNQFHVRVCHQDPPMPWLEVRVMHNKPSGGSYEVGLEFITSPTWNILLMFG